LQRRLFFTVFFIFLFFSSKATFVKGYVFGEKGERLPFTTISIKENNTNLITNEMGEFRFQIIPGRYVLHFMHIGYKTLSMPIEVSYQDTILNIKLSLNSYNLDEVKVRAGNEDPAYEIIRNAIKKRKQHQNEVLTFSCNSYLKGLIKTKNFPTSFMGQKINFEDGDTSKKKIIFLSETIADLYFRKPNETKINVTATRVSGETNGFGLSTPSLISFYENIISLPSIFNPRGFVSPIADGALSFYNYQYLGAFDENGILVNKIKVWPKRKWEPLFTGYIQIIENTWSIHSLNLMLSNESQLEFAKTLTIKQQMVNEGGFWMLQNQSIDLEASFLGFEVSGTFTSLFSNYKFNNDFSNNFFDNIIINYDSSSNTRSDQFWNEFRPLPLINDEILDYRKKDSLQRKKNNLEYLDSLDKIQNSVSLLGLIVNGETFIKRKKSVSIQLDPFLESFSYNTVEGWSVQISGNYERNLKGARSYSFRPVIRYGNDNGHLNAFFIAKYNYGKKYLHSIGLSAGKKIFQYNNTNPVSRFVNTFSTLFEGKNYLKIYEAKFFQFNYHKELGAGLDLDIGFSFQDRNSLNNLNKINIWTENRQLLNITPNFPAEIMSENMKENTSSVFSLKLKYRPATKYIRFPDRIIRNYVNTPLYTFSYAMGLPNLFGSNSSFSKWSLSVSQELNFKIGGEFKYLFESGGFFNNRSIFIPDYNHFPGNLTRKALPYVQSFQVAPFYSLSSNDRWFSTLFLEYSFNGMLTNKIPVIKRLNLRLITGSNIIFMPSKNYAEYFVGLDNILKLFRIDYVWGINNDIKPINGIKIGIKGFTRIFTEY
jgi:hypothetical protein